MSGTRVLVAAASRHGATQEIAEAVGRALAEHGLDADVRRVEDVPELNGYGAVVLGSGVYMGRWLEPARRFVDEHAADMALRPTWLFSSGPLGDPPQPPAEEAVHAAAVLAQTGARDHRVFAGRLDRSSLSLAQRAVVRAVGAAEGDFRDWDEIAAWADTIADELLD